MTTIAYDKNGQIIELYGLNISGGGGGGDVTMAQVKAEIAKNVGKGVQLGFDGTLENNIITFVPPIGSTPYQIKENYDYEIDLSFAVGGEVDDDTQMQISNDGLTFYFWTVKDTPATWGDLKDIYTYSNDVGYRWIFKARYHVTSEGNNVFYIYPCVNNAVNNIQLYFDGSHIYNKQGGTQLDYEDVYNIISNKYNLVTVNYADSNVLYPAFWTGDAVEFSNILMIDNKTYSTRLIINAQNQIRYDEEDLSSGGGSYTLPTASTTTLGGVKIDGTTITIDNGVISSVGGSGGETCIPSFQLLISSQDIGTFEIDLSNYLPNDGNNYEIYFRTYLNCKADGGYSSISIYDGEFISSEHPLNAGAVNSSAKYSTVCFWYPFINNSRTIYYTTTGSLYNYTMHAFGYRKIR